jgi:hypothetical protein
VGLDQMRALVPKMVPKSDRDSRTQWHTTKDMPCHKLFNPRGFLRRPEIGRHVDKAVLPSAPSRAGGHGN